MPAISGFLPSFFNFSLDNSPIKRRHLSKLHVIVTYGFMFGSLAVVAGSVEVMCAEEEHCDHAVGVASTQFGSMFENRI